MSKPDKNEAVQSVDPEVAARDPMAGAVDRPGFDLGGSVTDQTAGSALGLGKDAAESASGRRLPRGKSTDPAKTAKDPSKAHTDDKPS